MRSPTRTTAAGWRFTSHLRCRALERGISDADISAAPHDPQITYTQTSYGPNRQVRQRGELGLVVDLTTRTVITVVFRHHDRWTQHVSHQAATA